MLYRSTLTPALGIRRELDRLMDETLNRFAVTPEASASWGPALDVTEDKDGLLLEFELPGMQAGDVEITAEKGVLTVRGEKRTQRQREESKAVITERSFGRFVRAVRLPQGVDEASISAAFEDGLLRVRVPRAAIPQPRKIEIRANAATRPMEQVGPTEAQG